MKLLYACLPLLLVLSAFTPALSAAEDVPNFILIFTDDQGYQDVGCFGSPKIKTPNLDRMATEGMKFTDFYVGAPVCSASRASLMTGCYCDRVSVGGVLFPRDTTGLNPEEITIADLLQERGYATACIGKWHLGHHAPFLPTRQGFDSYFGIPYSNDMTIDPAAPLAEDILLREGATVEQIRAGQKKRDWVPLMRDEEVIEYPCDQTTLTQRYTREALGFIRANKDRPFFLYLPHTMPHVPLYTNEEFAGTSERGLYGDVIEEIDWSVGRILETLRETGLAENTMVLYTSDNGPWLSKKENGGCALPLRDGKFSVYEGGMREPTLMWWPGRIPAGTVCSEVAATIDVLPTFAALAGCELPSDRVIDGRDIRPLLLGRHDATSPHAMYFYKQKAVRWGDWKFHAKGKSKKPELYDLASDISESTNVAESHPEVVAKLTAALDAHRQDIATGKRPIGKAP